MTALVCRLVLLVWLCWPLAAAAQYAIKWVNSDLGQSFYSPPVVGADGTLYVVALDAGFGGRLYALDAAGAVRWRYPERITLRAAPAIGPDGTLYIFANPAGDNGLRAVNPDGSRRWSYPGTFNSAPAVGADGVIYALAGDALHAINPDGSERWRAPIGLSPETDVSPVIGAGGSVYVASARGELTAFDATGEAQWTFAFANDAVHIQAPVVGADGTLYVATFEDSTDPFLPCCEGLTGGRLYAINPDGSLRWQADDAVQQLIAPPAVGADGTLYVTTWDGGLHALGPDNGARRWSFASGAAVVGSTKQGSAPVVGAAGTILFGAWDGRLYAVNPDGTPSWSFASGGEIRSTPAFGPDGSLYFGSDDGRLYALSVPLWSYPADLNAGPVLGADGSVLAATADGVIALDAAGGLRWRWSTPGGEAVVAAPAVGTDGGIHFGALDGVFYSLDAGGNQRWSFPTFNAIEAPLLVGPDGAVYAGSTDEDLYVLNPDGTLRWSFGTPRRIVAAPALAADGTVYLASQTTLHALGADGGERWSRADVGGFRPNAVALGADGTVYVSERAGLAALNPDGSERWLFEPYLEPSFAFAGGELPPLALAADGSIYAGGDSSNAAEHNFYALNPDGTLQWIAAIDETRPAALDGDGVIYLGENGRVRALNPDGSERWSLAADGRVATPLVDDRGRIYFAAEGSALTALSPAVWAAYGADERLSRRDTRLSPRISRRRYSNDTTPTWRWRAAPGTEPTRYRYTLNSDDLAAAVETGAMSFTPAAPLADGGYVLSVQQRHGGRWSLAASAAIAVDTAPPQTRAEVGAGGPDTALVTLVCSDGPGSGCAQSYYSADGDIFRLYTEPVSVGLGDTLFYYSRDRAGNDGVVQQTAGETFTTLTLELSSPTLLQNETLEAAGKLSRRPASNQDLSDLTVVLKITAPDGEVRVLDTRTRTPDGQFSFGAVGGFSQKGGYILEAVFNASAFLAGSSSVPQTVLVGAAAGYAVIVQGKLGDSQDELAAHRKTTDRVYQTLLRRGFLADNVRYFSYDLSRQAERGVEVYAEPSRAGLRETLEQWAVARMNGVAAPLYLVLVDHGLQGVFYLDDEIVSPAELNVWLETLENQLRGPAAAEERVVVIGACYSGSFIPPLSRPGRTVVTSAAAGEESYKGPLEADGVRGGELFLDEFFLQLGQAWSLREAFLSASEKTALWTRRGGLGGGTGSYPDDAVQHPLLDDNGDRRGSNVLAAGGDGQRSAQRYLGVGRASPTNAPGSPAAIVAVHPPLRLSAGETAATVWAQVNDNSRAVAPWVVVRAPDKTLDPTGTSAVQLDMDTGEQIERVFLDPAPTRWEKNLDGFDQAGMYELFYFVRDDLTAAVSPLRRSLVYKDRPGNRPPGPFALLAPEDGATTATTLVFDWQTAVDPDGDPVSYSLLIAADSRFAEIVHRQDGLRATAAVVDRDAGLQDLTRYFWRVEALDSFGATRLSETRRFDTEDTNVPHGIISGLVQSDRTLAVLQGARVDLADGLTLAPGGASQPDTDDGGRYILVTFPGRGSLVARKPGYIRGAVPVTVLPGSQTVNLRLSPQGGGDNRVLFFDDFE